MESEINRTVRNHTELLTVLTNSRDHGTVIGIYIKAGHRKMLLSCVEQVIQTDDGPCLIVLKKIDLQGYVLTDNRISLHDIERVKSFACRYNDKLTRTLTLMAKVHRDLHHRIRAKEQTISTDDLMMIVIRTIDSGHRITITLTNGQITTGYLTELGFGLDSIFIAPALNSANTSELKISHITKIEFEIFHHYNGLSSRIFQVIRDRSALS